MQYVSLLGQARFGAYRSRSLVDGDPGRVRLVTLACGGRAITIHRCVAPARTAVSPAAYVSTDRGHVPARPNLTQRCRSVLPVLKVAPGLLSVLSESGRQAPRSWLLSVAESCRTWPDKGAANNVLNMTAPERQVGATAPPKPAVEGGCGADEGRTGE